MQRRVLIIDRSLHAPHLRLPRLTGTQRPAISWFGKLSLLDFPPGPTSGNVAIIIQKKCHYYYCNFPLSSLLTPPPPRPRVTRCAANAIPAGWIWCTYFSLYFEENNRLTRASTWRPIASNRKRQPFLLFVISVPLTDGCGRKQIINAPLEENKRPSVLPATS